MRDVTTDDLFTAEDMAPVGKRLKFQAALCALQLVSLGDLKGPLTLDMIRKLPPEDFDALVDAKDKADALGKNAPVD